MIKSILNFLKKKLMTNQTRDKVVQACAILDNDKPGWAKLVDLNKLTDLGNPWTCVLAQVYGNWGHHVDRLFGHKELYGVTSSPRYLEYWHELIKERQNEI